MATRSLASLAVAAALLVAAAFLVSSAVAQTGNLVVAKEFDSPFFVIGRNLTIKYSLHSVGDGPAYNVVLKDEAFSSEFFHLLEGSFEATFDEIPSLENKTHTFVLVPNTAGEYRDQAARGTYQRTADAEATHFQSSFVGTYTILTEAEYQTSYADHTFEWVIYAALSAVSTAVPLGLYYTSANKLVGDKPKTS